MRVSVSLGLAHRIRDLTLSLRDDPRSDADLLNAFVRDRDEGAFAVLVARHRQVVWDTCRTALGSDADAEDAFQAVFIALARDAQKVRPDTLGGWLYTVAVRASTNARVAARRREAAHRRLNKQATRSADAPPDEDLRAAVREELAGLPEPLRVPLTLYYLEGKTQADVGRILGVTDRAAAARLRRGLVALRRQLDRRGVSVSSGVLTAVLGGVATNPVAAAAPAGLVAAATDAALAAAAGQPPGTAAAHLATGLTGPGTGRAKLYGFVLALAGLGAVGGVMGLGGTDADRDGVPVELVPAAEPLADRLGDALPAGAVARIGTHRFRSAESRGAEDVAFFPDGRTLASVHGGAEVTLWETATGKPSRVFGGPAGARWVAASPDGSRLAVAGAAEVWVWAIGADAPRVLWKWRAIQFPPQPAVTALAFSPDSSVVAVGDREEKCTRLFRAATGEEIETLAGQPLALSAAPGGTYLATIGGRNRTAWADRLVFWDAAAGRAGRVLDAGAGEVFVDVALSADGRAVVRTAKGAVRLIDVATGRASGDWSVRDGARRGLAFLPGGKELIEVDNGRVRFRNPATGAETRSALALPALLLHSLNHNFDTTRYVSPDGRHLAVPCGGEIVVWDLATGLPAGPPGQVRGAVRALAFSPDGRSVLTFADRVAEVRVWDAETGEPGPVLAAPTGDGFKGLGWGADGRPLTLCRVAPPAGSGPLLRSDLRTGRPVEWVPLPPVSNGSATPLGYLAPFASTPSGGRTAVASGREIDVLDPAGAVVRRLTVRESVARVALSADGRTLAAVTYKWPVRAPGDGPRPPRVEIELWNVATGGRLPAPAGAGEWDLFQVPPALSADGRWVAVATWGRGVALAEVATGRTGQQFECPGRPLAVTFSPDGRRLVAGDADGAVTVWDLAAGRAAHRFAGHRGPVTALSFAPDGRRLASGSADGTALIWDTAGLKVSAAAGPRRTSGELGDAVFGADAAAAHRATFALGDQPDLAVRLAAGRLAAPPPAAEVDQWVEDLGDNRDTVRERAQAALEQAGEAAGPVLLKGLAGDPPPEVRVRLERLVARLEAGTDAARVAAARAVAVLERAGTPAARRALEDAARRSGPAVRAEAEAALQRMGNEPAPR